MKKFLITAVLCLLTVTLIFGIIGCTQKGNEVANTKYDINIDFCGEQIVCTQSTTVTNTYCDGLEELVFLLAPNAYSDTAKHKAYSTKLPAYGSVTVTESKVNGEEVECVFDEENYFLIMPVPTCNLNDTIVVDFCYRLSLPECNLRLGYKDGYYNLSNFYPQLCCFENGEFRKNYFHYVGDPIMSDVADYQVTISVPENMVVACPGNVSENISDGKKIIVATENNVRDFAFAMNENYTVKTYSVEGVTVKYFSVGQSDYSELAGNVIKTFSENFTEYPYDNYVLAETAFDPEGMEYSGMCYISKDSSDFEKTVIHETIHQWFYNLVGNDNINSPFLDEGLTTFMTEYYYALIGENEKYVAGMKQIEESYLSYERLQKMRGNKGTFNITKSIFDYSEYSYSMLVYYKTSMMFKNLCQMAGKEKFLKGIKLYIKENRFKRGTLESMIACFEKAMGCEVKGLIEGWCSASVATAKFS